MQRIPDAPAFTPRQERAAWFSLLVCLCFLVLDRWLILHQFGFRYVDDDQAIMWNGAAEMAHGHFHEPCFYGQRYNTMLEGLVAVPLLWAGVGPEVALPLMTSALALFPFVLLAALLARKRAFAPAACALAMPVLMSPEYGMITSMPRGFVSGIFLASLAVLPLFSRRRIFYFLWPFFGILALFANPNAVVLLLPVGLLLLVEYRSELRFYLLGVAGALPAAVLYWLGQRFYDVHPAYVVHGAWSLDFNTADIRWGALRYFEELSPLLWGKGLVVFIALGLLVAALAKARQWKPAIALFIGIIFLLASWGLGKVNEGTPGVFFPWARMYLAIPVVLVLFATRLKCNWPQWSVYLIPMLAAGFFGYKCIVQGEAVERQITMQGQRHIEVAEVAELKRHCAHIGGLAHATHADLIVVAYSRKKHLTNYGCPCLAPDFPPTMEPEIDRRTWHLQVLAAQVMPNVLFVGFVQPYPPFSQVLPLAGESGLRLLKGNALRTDSMLDELGLGMRAH
jgi:hypothetical protein